MGIFAPCTSFMPTQAEPCRSVALRPESELYLCLALETAAIVGMLQGIQNFRPPQDVQHEGSRVPNVCRLRFIQTGASMPMDEFACKWIVLLLNIFNWCQA